MQAIDDLLVPLGADLPSGEDLCFSAEFDAIAQARRYDDPSLDQGEWVTDLKEADWKFVIDRCSVLLRTRTRDLRLAVWLAEAAAKMDGFKGLAEGYRLISGMCDTCWETMHPLTDGDDAERRIGNLTWLLGRSAQLVREMPLTEGRGTAYSFADFDAARARAPQAEKALADGLPAPVGVKLADMEAARRKSSRAFIERLLADAQDCRDALSTMEKSIDARLGVDGPGFSPTRHALDDVIALISRFAQEAGVRREATRPSPVADAAPAHATLPGLPASATSSLVALQGNGPIQHRSQALAQLREVAEFFRRTEPHSPVAYLADKAAEWGDLPLHLWLQSVIKDNASLSHVEELLGLSPRAPSGE